jgi:hypothetical protein
MSGLRTKRRTHKEPDWFDFFSSALFLFIGASLLGRAMWHMLMHNDFMPKTLMSGGLFITVGVLFARQALKSSSSEKGSVRK